MSLSTLHLMLLCLWGGLVMAEVILELSSTESELAHTAKVHLWLDLLVELPLLLGVLLTGILLSAQQWPLSALLWTKIVCGLLAISLNLYCFVMVLLRHRTREPQKRRQYHQRVLFSGVGFPFAMVAAYLGLVYFL